jgi:hypothetical protein
MLRAVLLAAVAVLVAAAPACARPLRLDRAFGDAGKRTVRLKEDAPRGIVLLRPTGRIVLVGAKFRAVQLTGSGRIDRRWGRSGRAVVAPPRTTYDAHTDAAALLPDGSIVMAGSGTHPSLAPAEIVVAKLTPGGLPDPAFGVRGQARVPVGGFLGPASLLVSPTGAVTVAVARAWYLERPFVALARLSAAGALEHFARLDGVGFYEPVGLVAAGDGLFAVARSASKALRITAIDATGVPRSAYDIPFGGLLTAYTPLPRGGIALAQRGTTSHVVFVIGRAVARLRLPARAGAPQALLAAGGGRLYVAGSRQRRYPRADMTLTRISAGGSSQQVSTLPGRKVPLVGTSLALSPHGRIVEGGTFGHANDVREDYTPDRGVLVARWR